MIKTGGNPTSKTPAHRISITVATFRSWRDSQTTIAKPPAGLPLQDQSIEIFTNLARDFSQYIQVFHSSDYFTNKVFKINTINLTNT